MAAGGIDAWNAMTDSSRQMLQMLDSMCTATTPEEALVELDAMAAMGHLIWAYAYMRMLYNKDMDLYYATILKDPAKLLGIVYTPTVGEACQKFGVMPFFPRGCYVSLKHRGRIAAVLRDYAEAHLERREDGTFALDCIVFSDGGRILGLGDLGAWGMGIPIGKLDLYTVCAGVHPRRTMPVILDMGVSDRSGNTARLDIRDHQRYTGLKQERETHRSEAGTVVNTAYYGPDNVIDEFMTAAKELFGEHILLQYEDFNSNDAFPLLESTRDRYLTYNDDIQGTAAVTVAGILGALKLRHPNRTDLVELLKDEKILFHGAGSANIGSAMLLVSTAGLSPSQIFLTNSKGLIWRSADGGEGSFRNNEQKRFAVEGKPAFDTKDLVAVVQNIKPSFLIGAVGRDPNCFTQEVINKMVEAEVTAHDAYTWSQGQVIFGCGTAFDPVTIDGRTHSPGQVNNVYIFPGLSMGAISCKARTLSDDVFLAAAEAVANSLSGDDLREDRVVPHPARIREVGLNVATGTALACDKLGACDAPLGATFEEVREKIKDMMWEPDASRTC